MRSVDQLVVPTRALHRAERAAARQAGRVSTRGAGGRRPRSVPPRERSPVASKLRASRTKLRRIVHEASTHTPQVEHEAPRKGGGGRGTCVASFCTLNQSPRRARISTARSSLGENVKSLPTVTGKHGNACKSGGWETTPGGTTLPVDVLVDALGLIEAPVVHRHLRARVDPGQRYAQRKCLQRQSAPPGPCRAEEPTESLHNLRNSSTLSANEIAHSQRKSSTLAVNEIAQRGHAGACLGSLLALVGQLREALHKLHALVDTQQGSGSESARVRVNDTQQGSGSERARARVNDTQKRQRFRARTW